MRPLSSGLALSASVARLVAALLVTMASGFRTAALPEGNSGRLGEIIQPDGPSTQGAAAYTSCLGFPLNHGRSSTANSSGNQSGHCATHAAAVASRVRSGVLSRSPLPEPPPADRQ